jgi:hypothetical protein
MSKWRVPSAVVMGTSGNCCKQAWLLKNSFTENWLKKLCNRKPYKRRSRFSWKFCIPQIFAV